MVSALPGDSGTLARFLNEAEAVARLQHPNIVHIYKAGRWQDWPYLALELVEGGTLAEKIAGRPLPSCQAAELVETLARAISHAHERGVIHRDLTPANILLTKTGVPKISDFGLAKLFGDSKDTHVRTETLVGTPSYMAPEQIQDSPQTGRHTDIYGLGAILYEALTGRPPFRADNPLATLRQVESCDPVPPCRLQPDLPRDLEAVCLKCLEKEPARRYASAQDLADDLRRFLRGEPVQARPVGWLARGWRWCRRNPLAGGLIGLIATVLVGVAVVASLAACWFNQERKRARAAEADAVENLRHSYLDQARAARSSRQAGRRFASLAALARAADLRPGPEVRNEVIASLALADLRVGRQWTIGKDGIAFDPRWRRYVRWDRRGVLKLCRLADHRVLRTLRGPKQPAWVVQFSPRGTYLAAKFHQAGQDQNNKIRVWKVDAGQTVLAAEGMAYVALDFSPDERLMALGRPDRSLRFYELASGRQIRSFPLEMVPYQVRFHPRGHRVAVSSLDAKTVQVRDCVTGKLVREWSAGCGFRGIAWHPEARLLAAAGTDLRVHLWDPQTGAAHAALEGHGWIVTQVAFSRGGDCLVSTGWDHKLVMWDPWGKRQVLSVPAWHTAGAAGLQFSPDDTQFACRVSRGKVQLWELALGRECRFIPIEHSPDHRLWGTSLSPDGRFLALARSSGVRLLAVAGGQEIGYLPIGMTRSALFHPKEAALYTWGERGLWRWPIGKDRRGVPCQIGPPEFLGVKGHHDVEWAALSADGRILAAGHRARGEVVVVDLGARKVLFRAPHPSPSEIAVSPTGEWVAGATWTDPAGAIRIWEVATGKKVKELPGGNHAVPAFSPDGRWLVAGLKRGGCRIWHTGSWTPGPPLPGSGRCLRALACCPHGNLLAVSPEPGLLRLLRIGSWEEVAALPAGEPLTFSRDGSCLVTMVDQALMVWNLRALRQQLRARKLDWELPAFPAEGAQPPVGPWKVVAGDWPG
jgi:WD40 repeat protein